MQIFCCRFGRQVQIQMVAFSRQLTWMVMHHVVAVHTDRNRQTQTRSDITSRLTYDLLTVTCHDHHSPSPSSFQFYFFLYNGTLSLLTWSKYLLQKRNAFSRTCTRVIRLVYTLYNYFDKSWYLPSLYLDDNNLSSWRGWTSWYRLLGVFI